MAAILRLEGINQMIRALDGLDKTTMDDMCAKMCEAGGKVAAAEVRRQAIHMLIGPYNRGGVAASVTTGKPRKGREAHWVEIKFSGKQHGENLARIAYINEYGAKKRQKARPFISRAFAICADAATEAARNAMDEFLGNRGL